MQRGNLVIYDLNGKIFLQTGEAEGDVLPHDCPVGLPYVILPYGSTNGKRILSIDVETKIPITEDLPKILTQEEIVQQAIDEYTLSLIEMGVL